MTGYALFMPNPEFNLLAEMKSEEEHKGLLRRAMIVVDIFLGVIFLLFSFFQWNDPDPVLWMTLYIIPSIFIFLILSGRIYLKWIAAYGGIVLLVMIFYIPSLISWFNLGLPSIANTMQAETPYIESIREFFGLFICFLVSLFYLLRFK